MKTMNSTLSRTLCPNDYSKHHDTFYVVSLQGRTLKLDKLDKPRKTDKKAIIQQLFWFWPCTTYQTVGTIYRIEQILLLFGVGSRHDLSCLLLTHLSKCQQEFQLTSHNRRDLGKESFARDSEDRNPPVCMFWKQRSAARIWRHKHLPRNTRHLLTTYYTTTYPEKC